MENLLEIDEIFMNFETNKFEINLSDQKFKNSILKLVEINNSFE